MKLFLLKFKKDNTESQFPTLVSIFANLDKKVLGVSKFTLDRFDFQNKIFENEFISLQKIEIDTKFEIKKEKKYLLKNTKNGKVICISKMYKVPLKIDK